MDAVGEWSHGSDMDCEKDKQRIRRFVFMLTTKRPLYMKTIVNLALKRSI